MPIDPEYLRRLVRLLYSLRRRRYLSPYILERAKLRSQFGYQYEPPTPTIPQPEEETVMGRPIYETAMRQRALTRTRERLREQRI